MRGLFASLSVNKYVSRRLPASAFYCRVMSNRLTDECDISPRLKMTVDCHRFTAAIRVLFCSLRDTGIISSFYLSHRRNSSPMGSIDRLRAFTATSTREALTAAPREYRSEIDGLYALRLYSVTPLVAPAVASPCSRRFIMTPFEAGDF